MRTCSEDPHLCGASWLLRFTSLLLSVCSAVTQSPGARGSAVDDSGNPVPLKGTLGASVLFHMIKNPDLPPGAKLESITWGIINQKVYTPILQVSPGGDGPRWVNFQDKYEKRVHVVNTTTLRIDNLTLEDSGLYRAQESYMRGRQYDQDFHLTVYEPVPRPQIQAMDLSLTPGWCNLTLECDLPRTREDLMVSWESECLPRELEQRPAPGPAPNPWTLAVTLPLSRPSPSLTCVVSNQVDQKNVTLDLGDVCGRDRCCPLAWYPGVCYGRAADPRSWSWAVPLEETWDEEARGAWDRQVALLLPMSRHHHPTTTPPLNSGLLFSCILLLRECPCRRLAEAGSKEEPRDPDGGIHYAELSQQGSRGHRDKGRGEPHLEEEKSLTTVYSEVRRPGHAMTAF
ncbi:uncharacterized protein LOC131814850 isoform X1 [Mustela lutreola]|uniref:uncharacterized protein LOC131814850 isoform X1 n=1 Tax=Mustela lutreola TaxID=9666 RepID=UPI002796EBF5|nr:uncharacterized protein LOC131814850 isoform X1 [Mustela lutreola]